MLGVVLEDFEEPCWKIGHAEVAGLCNVSICNLRRQKSVLFTRHASMSILTVVGG